MEDWVKKILENRQRRHQEKENEKQERIKNEADKEANRQKATSYISDKAVPAFKKAKEILESDEIGMRAHYYKLEGNTSIKMEVSPKTITRANEKTFQYCIDMEYTSYTITPYAICSSGDGKNTEKHKIEKNNSNSEIPKMTYELINITTDDIYNDLMKYFFNFDDQNYKNNPQKKSP